MDSQIIFLKAPRLEDPESSFLIIHLQTISQRFEMFHFGCFWELIHPRLAFPAQRSGLLNHWACLAIIIITVIIIILIIVTVIIIVVVAIFSESFSYCSASSSSACGYHAWV